MIDLKSAQITRLITHHIGSALHEDSCVYSADCQTLSSSEGDVLSAYFLGPLMEREDLFALSHTEGLEHNYIFQSIKSLLTNHDNLVNISKGIGEKLYHAMNGDVRINPGYLHVVYFENVLVIDELVSAIGIFKSENESTFVKVELENGNQIISFDQGFDLGRLDKSFLSLGTESDSGYVCLSYDRHSVTNGAKYWNEDFLNLRKRENDYLYTSEVMHMAKEFVTDELPENFSVERADQIDYLNRSKAYFEQNEKYDRQQFADEVFPNEDLQMSFQAFEERYKEETNSNWPENFELSNKAVKRESRVFKSILKLDKNFHVYIHGDRSKIERGREADGRKFYKIYYEDEH